MDPTMLAGTAVGLLTPILGKIGEGGLTRIGEAVTEKGLEPLTRLYIGIKERLRGDAYAETVLAGAVQRPDSQARLGALEATLAELLAADPDFTATLERLVGEAKTVSTIHAEDSGAVAGGNMNISGTYVAGRDMHVGD